MHTLSVDTSESSALCSDSMESALAAGFEHSGNKEYTDPFVVVSGVGTADSVGSRVGVAVGSLVGAVDMDGATERVGWAEGGGT